MSLLQITLNVRFCSQLHFIAQSVFQYSTTELQTEIKVLQHLSDITLSRYLSKELDLSKNLLLINSISNKYLTQTIRSNVTNNNNKIWKTVWLINSKFSKTAICNTWLLMYLLCYWFYTFSLVLSRYFYVSLNLVAALTILIFIAAERPQGASSNIIRI